MVEEVSTKIMFTLPIASVI